MSTVNINKGSLNGGSCREAVGKRTPLEQWSNFSQRWEYGENMYLSLHLSRAPQRSHFVRTHFAGLLNKRNDACRHGSIVSIAI